MVALGHGSLSSSQCLTPDGEQEVGRAGGSGGEEGDISASEIPNPGNQLLHFWKVEITVWEGDVFLQGQTALRVQVRVGTMKKRTASAR